MGLFSKKMWHDDLPSKQRREVIHNFRPTAQKEEFEAFGVLYYPNFVDVASEDAVPIDEDDMAFAMTCVANMEGTGYTLAPEAIVTLARSRHWVKERLGSGEEIDLQYSLDPAADIRALVPSVKADPMYPGFPLEVMQIDEMRYRLDQMRHYSSTYGVEWLAGLFGVNVQVGRGWLPHDGERSAGAGGARAGGNVSDDAGRKGQAPEYAVLADAKPLVVVTSDEAMREIILARIARPTRMHDLEVRCAVKHFLKPGAEEPLVFGFHENMLEMVRIASQGSSSELRDMLLRTAQHPGDVLKAANYVRLAHPEGKARLSNRQKKGFCQALSRFPYQTLVENIADARPEHRRALNYLSIGRFGDGKLKRAVNAVGSGAVTSWNSRIERAWERLAQDGPEPLLALYAQRPGMLLRSLTRLAKGGVPVDLIAKTVEASDAYSISSLARTLAILSADDLGLTRMKQHPNESEEAFATRRKRHLEAYRTVTPIVRGMLARRLAGIDTPLRGRRVYVDAGGFSLDSSVLMPNDSGNTGTAYPPAGMAYALPPDATVRFFTFWNDQEKRVDVDLHFYAWDEQAGETYHVGWDGAYLGRGMVTSGDITHSDNAVEYLDLNMAEAHACGVDYVKQVCHIFDGASSWANIETCFSGAMVVEALGDIVAAGGEGAFASGEAGAGAHEGGAANAMRAGVVSAGAAQAGAMQAAIYQAENLIFRDDMTGAGRSMTYALVDVKNGAVRIQRGAKYPFVRTSFPLGAYIDLLIEAQGATRVAAPDQADVVLSVGRTDKEGAICLIDEGFFLG